MANSKPFATVVELGERLVDELSLGDSNDTLALWMAHYVADKIRNAQSATGKNRRSAQEECARSIFELWKHRNSLPEGRRPFGEWEALFRALSTLDTERTEPRYFRDARVAAEQETLGAKSTEWLTAATSLDYAARVLIRYCLAQAAEHAADNAQEWIGLIAKLDRRDEFDVRIVHYVAEDIQKFRRPTETDLRREAIEGMIGRLEAFENVAKALAIDLRHQLKSGTRKARRRGQTTRSTKGRNTRSYPKR